MIAADKHRIQRPFNPSRQDHAHLESVTVARETILSDIMKGIADQSRRQTNQHRLLIGPRGMGKSHVIALIYHRVRRDQGLTARWLPVWFPEEATGIVSLRDFMEKVLAIGANELQEGGLGQEADKFRRAFDKNQNETDNRRVIDRIKAFLLDWRKAQGRKLLVLLENADRVIGSRIAKKPQDEKWLRDLLMNSDVILVVATSPTYFKQVTNKDHPLYEIFRIDPLEDLDFNDSLAMMVKYAGQDERGDLVAEFGKRSKRIQAIHALAGGNPRILLMLYVLIRDSLDNIKDVEVGFHNLLEELTPYFQARTGQLGDQEERILMAFAEGPDLLTPAEVGRRLRLATNVVTANLDRLQSAGFIKKEEKMAAGRRGTLYRLSETIYRFWYQMNSERSRELAEILVRFIVLYYTREELEQMYRTKGGGAAEGDLPEVRYLKSAIEATGIGGSAIGEKEPGQEEVLWDIIKSSSAKAKKKGKDKHEVYNNWGLALSDLALMKGDEALFRESFEKYALAVKYKEDLHEAYYNWGLALSELARMKGDESLFRESFEKYNESWRLIKKLPRFDHPLMINAGLKAAGSAMRTGNEEGADILFSEVVAHLPGVVNIKPPVVPYLFGYFESLATEGKWRFAARCLERLLAGRLGKHMKELTPFRKLFEYQEKKDPDLIRRQPPELRRILEEMIAKIEKTKTSNLPQ